MIVLRHGIPLVITPKGHSASFNKEWIIVALEQASKRAGQEHWSMASELTDAITIYLQQECKGTVITLEKLEKVIENLLISLKYEAIAATFSLPDPPVSLSLLELVQEAGTAYELVFFPLLRKRLQEIAESSSLRLEINDLEPCLRQLQHRVRLGSHDILREEIVNFIRRYGRSHFFLNKRKNQKPLEIELS
ncbi:MAG: hypothetical protein DVB29_01060 [Verrucomicrobia bacterium]|jgi:hypothetical protein|nr:MAG: hypothetical protein DVB29_01060 [Verrucomicrobiota bacterium]MDH4470607.1 hypothetical protein [Verrucomicrobiae bacterium]